MRSNALQRVGDFIGDYKVISILKSDEGSSVYLTEHTNGSKVVLKGPSYLPPPYRVDESFLKNEINILRKLSHPNIIKPIETFEHKGFSYLATPYSGDGLFQAMKEKNPESASDFLSQMAGTLVYLNQKGIIHADISPHEIVKSNGNYFLLDFGGAVDIKSEKPFYKRNCNSFSPPEQLNATLSFKPVKASETTDIFSLGLITATALTAEVLNGEIYLKYPFSRNFPTIYYFFKGEKLGDIAADAIRDSQSRDDSEEGKLMRTFTEEKLIPIIKRMLKKNPQERIMPQELSDVVNNLAA